MPKCYLNRMLHWFTLGDKPHKQLEHCVKQTCPIKAVKSWSFCILLVILGDKPHRQSRHCVKQAHTITTEKSWSFCLLLVGQRCFCTCFYWTGVPMLIFVLGYLYAILSGRGRQNLGCQDIKLLVIKLY